MSKRIKFFLGHLSISFIVALLAIIIVFYIWYPAPLAKANGVSHVFIMMLAIDVVVGPLFTLLIYKEKKRTLKFDLGVIILIQISAFLYGFHTIAQGRPAWLVFYYDRFDQVRVVDIDRTHLDQAEKQYKKPSLLGMQYVAVKFAEDAAVRRADTQLELSGVTLAERPERFLAIDMVTADIRKKAQDLKVLEQYNSKLQVKNVLEHYPLANGWLPLKATDLDMVVLINKEKGEVVKIVDLRPWK